MKQHSDNIQPFEQIIAGLLWYGTWLASAIIAAGMILSALEQLGWSLLPFSGYMVAGAGIALFIFLPIARVILMLGIFLRNRDYLYVVLSALILAIIAAGMVIGLR